MLNAHAIKQQIHNLILQNPELAEDDVLRADMIEGSSDLHEVLALLLDRMRESEALAEAITARIKSMQERRARIEGREVSLRALMFSLMEAADLRKVELPEATLSFRNTPPKLVVVDEAKIPSMFFEQKPVLDKVHLKSALASGNLIEGASLSNGGVSLVVRAS